MGAQVPETKAVHEHQIDTVTGSVPPGLQRIPLVRDRTARAQSALRDLLEEVRVTPDVGEADVPAADTPFAAGSPAVEASTAVTILSVSDTLGRFKTAQADPRSGFTAALRELRAGHKRTRWIWYLFPSSPALARHRWP